MKKRKLLMKNYEKVSHSQEDPASSGIISENTINKFQSDSTADACNLNCQTNVRYGAATRTEKEDDIRIIRNDMNNIPAYKTEEATNEPVKHMNKTECEKHKSYNKLGLSWAKLSTA